jgi:threonine aldolase
MMEAEVGDDVYGEDPTVNRLEQLAAELVGKEAAVFVPSGTMGNQLAIMTHCERGVEVICDRKSHIFNYEMAAASVLSGVQLHPVDDLHNEKGIGTIMGDFIRPPSPFLPRTRLVCLENTLNADGGTVMRPEQMAVVYRLAHEYGLQVHLDGARIFNAAVALDCEVTDLTCYTDSVMFCLSKGLGAPVGSILAGEKTFIEQARRYRKLLGGGMRQAGILAAAGILALNNISSLSEDHQKARALAAALSGVPGAKVDLEKVETNIVLLDLKELPARQFLELIGSNGVLAGAQSCNTVRFVTHRDVTMDDIQEAAEIIKAVLCQ